MKQLKRLLAMIMAVLMVFTGMDLSGLNGLLTAYAAAPVITPSEPSQDENGVYLIGTAQELYWFAAKVNGTDENIVKDNAANARLTSDITVNTGVLNENGELNGDGTNFTAWTPIANAYTTNSYSGTFDGDNHTIRGLYCNSGEYDSEVVGLFGYLSCGIIKNVTLKDSYIHKDGYEVGGICGINDGVIIDCVNYATVSGWNDIGGICGCVGKTITGAVIRCVNLGNVSGTTNYIGGVYGDMSGTNGSMVSDSFSIGKVIGTSVTQRIGAVGGRGFTTSVKNCYYNKEVFEGNGIGTLSGDRTGVIEARTTEQFMDGNLAYTMNGERSIATKEEPIRWYQNIDNGKADICPIPNSTHGTVYPAASYDDNGFLLNKEDGCTNLIEKYYTGAYKAPELSNGIYQIYNAGNLYWFAVLVNGDTSENGTNGVAQNESADASLMADITINKNVLNENGELNEAPEGGYREWIPIGCTALGAQYKGAFCGNGRTVSGLYYNDSTGSDIGFIGHLGHKAENQEHIVKEIMIDDSYLCGGNNVGSICGYNEGGDIEYCSNRGTVSAGSNAGGICGESKRYIMYCMNTGKVDAGSNVGSICGINKGNIYYCYYDNTVYPDMNVAGTNELTVSEAMGMSSDEWKSGKVTALLNIGFKTIWRQNIDNDETWDTYPVLDTTHAIVYSVNTYDDNGYKIDGELSYTNDSNYDIPGIYEKPLFKDGAYQIGNAGNLYWFAALVNGNTNIKGITEAVPDANAILTDDIILNQNVLEAPDAGTYREWTSIGSQYEGIIGYAGTFDGNGKTISGLYGSGENGKCVGLFYNTLADAKIMNVNMTDAYINTGMAVMKIGFIVSGSNEGFIDSCSVEGTVESSAAAGLVNTNGGTIRNCRAKVNLNVAFSSGGICIKNNGTIEACGNEGSLECADAAAYIGGICVENNGTIKACYNSGTISGINYVGGICSKNGKEGNIIECISYGSVICDGIQSDGICVYNIGNITTSYFDRAACGLKVTADQEAYAKTTQEFQSGAVTQLLNEGRTSGTDESPLYWYQNIDNGKDIDTYPVLNSEHGTVYYGYPGCYGDGYSNTVLDADRAEHTFDNGICTECNEYEQPEQIGGVYQIKNAGNLYWFAALVNGDTSKNGTDGTAQNREANAVLVNDITVNQNVLDENMNLNDGEYAGWTPIGNSEESYYMGNFDGNSKTISGLYMNDTEASYAGLFGYTSASMVSNVTLKDSYFNGKDYVGGICGYKAGGRIAACTSMANVNSKEYSGGIAGRLVGNTAGCISISKVSGTTVGGICGYLEMGIIAGCFYDSTLYTDGDVTGEYEVGIGIYDSTGMSSEKLMSGKAAYCMNHSDKLAEIDSTLHWYQNVDNDGTVDRYPVTDSTHGEIYRIMRYDDNGYPDDSKAAYTNDISKAGECEYEKPKTVNEVYQIVNAGNLYWFAAFVNGDTTVEGITEAHPSASAILTKDITINTDVMDTLVDDDGKVIYFSDSDINFKKWTPIVNYEGTFNGNGMTISGMYYYANSTDAVGLFGNIAENGTVCNLNIEDTFISNWDSNYTRTEYTGIICGKNEGNILDCSVSGYIQSEYATGGICGINSATGNISCCLYNSFMRDSYRVGGICAINDGGTITNSYYNLDRCITDLCYVRNAVGENLSGTVTDVEPKTAAELKSGAVTYLLNGRRTSGTSDSPLYWYQNVDRGVIDDVPVLSNDSHIVYQYTDDSGNVYYSNKVANTIMKVTTSNNFVQKYDGNVKSLSGVNGEDFVWSGSGTANIKYYTLENDEYSLTVNDGAAPTELGTYYARVTVLENDDYLKTISDDYYEFRIITPVAQIVKDGKVTGLYDDFMKALEAAQSQENYGCTLQLADNVTTTGEYAVNIYSDGLIIDLNGYTWNVFNDEPISIHSGGSITIEDSMGTGKIVGDGSKLTNLLDSTAYELKITGGTFGFINNQDGNEYYSLHHGLSQSVVIEGGSFKDGVYLFDCMTATISGGTFEKIVIESDRDDAIKTLADTLKNGSVYYYTDGDNAGQIVKDTSVSTITNVTVGAGTPTLSVQGTISKTYDGKADIVIPNDKTNGYTSSISEKPVFAYYTDSECTHMTTSADGAAAEGAVPVNAGTYYVKASYENNDYHYAVSATGLKYVINKAVYNMSGAKWNYDEAFAFDNKDKTVIVTGLPEGVTVGSYTDNVKKASGTYTAKAVLDYDSDNYEEPVINNITWTINECTHSWSDWIVTKPATYDEAGIETSTCSICGKTKTREIAKLIRTDISTADVTGIKDMIYTGSEITFEELFVKLGDKTLTVGTDYTVKYSDNKEVGTATVTVTGCGAYEGVVTKTFNVAKAVYDMSNAKWDYDGAFAFDNTEKTVTVTGLPDGVTVSAYTDNKALKAGTYTASVTFSYDETHYEEPVIKELTWTINECTHTWGDWTVTTPATYDEEGVETRTCSVCGETETRAIPKLEKVDISKAKLTGVGTKYYNGKSQKQSKMKVTLDGVVLTYGTDYKVSYKNNKNIGTATITVTGTGKYTGRLTKKFSIKVKKNASYTVSSMKYKITNSAVNGKGTVTLTGVTTSKSKLKSLMIGSKVKIGGKYFMITAIGSKVLKGYTKLAKVTIGSYVTSIGSEAFSGCKTLKSVKISSKKLKSVGKYAVKGIYKKAVIQAPASRIKAYMKIFKSSTGFIKSMKVKK